MKIRPSRLADFAFIVRLSETAFHRYGSYGNTLGATFLKPQVTTRVAEDDSGPFGFVMLQRKQDAVELIAIAVATAHRNRQVGARLLQAGIRWAEGLGARRLGLHTGVDNMRALGLFGSAGFISTGTVPAYYPEGQTAVRMRLAL